MSATNYFSRASRVRKALEVTLSPGARAKLERMVKTEGLTRSAILDRLILQYPGPADLHDVMPPARGPLGQD